MRWEDLPESQNVEDRRGEEGGGGGFGRGGGGFPGGAGGLVDRHDSGSRADRIRDRHRSEHADRRRRPVLAPAAARRADAARAARPQPGASPKDETGQFVTRILASTETTWKDIFAKSNRHLSPAGAGALLGQHPRQLRRQRDGGDGTVLLSRRQEDLSRHLVLPDDRDPLPRLRRRQPVLPLRAGLCDRA